MNSSGRLRIGGYILMESLLSLTITFILVSALAGLVLASTRATHRIETRLRAERELTAAQITVLVMIRHGDDPGVIEARLRQEYPAVVVRRSPDQLELRYGSEEDREGAAIPVTIVIPRSGDVR